MPRTNKSSAIHGSHSFVLASKLMTSLTKLVLLILIGLCLLAPSVENNEPLSVLVFVPGILNSALDAYCLIPTSGNIATNLSFFVNILTALASLSAMIFEKISIFEQFQLAKAKTVFWCGYLPAFFTCILVACLLDAGLIFMALLNFFRTHNYSSDRWIYEFSKFPDEKNQDSATNDPEPVTKLGKSETCTTDL